MLLLNIIIINDIQVIMEFDVVIIRNIVSLIYYSTYCMYIECTVHPVGIENVQYILWI